METRSSLSRSLHTNRGLEKLEPYEGKLSCTVLRGEEDSNALDLPDKVNFESDAIKRGPSETVTFSQLSDWTKHEDTRIKYFSGTANYKTMVNLKSIPNAKVYLDLGEVSVMAKVKINGKDSGGVWTAPYRVDITDAVRIGKNTIEVEVVNTWLNRIIGDRKLSENERILTPNTVPWKDSTPLQKSGLLGPVRIVTKD